MIVIDRIEILFVMLYGALFYLACLLYAIYLKAENCVPELLNCFLYIAVNQENC